jgi:hypothetical protein
MPSSIRLQYDLVAGKIEIIDRPLIAVARGIRAAKSLTPPDDHDSNTFYPPNVTKSCDFFVCRRVTPNDTMGLVTIKRPITFVNQLEKACYALIHSTICGKFTDPST